MTVDGKLTRGVEPEILDSLRRRKIGKQSASKKRDEEQVNTSNRPLALFSLLTLRMQAARLKLLEDSSGRRN